jgi:hypothetical protein
VGRDVLLTSKLVHLLEIWIFKKSSEETTSFLDLMKILVDADACPRSVLRTCIRLGRKYKVPIWTVASFNHRIESDHPIAVGDGFQEADIKIVNLTEAGDLVVTGDGGLAAMVLGQGVSSRKSGLSVGGTGSQGEISSRRRKNERPEKEDIGR